MDQAWYMKWYAPKDHVLLLYNEQERKMSDPFWHLVSVKNRLCTKFPHSSSRRGNLHVGGGILLAEEFLFYDVFEEITFTQSIWGRWDGTHEIFAASDNSFDHSPDRLCAGILLAVVTSRCSFFFSRNGSVVDPSMYGKFFLGDRYQIDVVVTTEARRVLSKKR